VNRRYPYSSSYQLTSSAWDYYQSDFGPEAPSRRVRQASNHNQWLVPADADFTQRPVSDVAYPSGKVLVHDSHQRHFGDRMPFFGLEEARLPLLMVDGSVSVRQTDEANPGWDPGIPSFPCEVFTYSPSSWEPDTVDGGFADFVKGFYRWTRGGLKGIDFGAKPLDTGQADPGECNL